MNKRKRNNGIVIDIALLLLCLAVFSSCLASGMFAKFVTKAPSNAQTARVATWDITAARAEGETDPTTLVYESGMFDGTGTFTVNITNASEVAAKYTVEFVFPDNVKEYVKVTHGDDTEPITPVDGRIIVEGSALAAGNGTATETFTFAVTDGALGVEDLLWTLDSENTLKASTSEAVSFVAVVKFVQVD